MSDEDVEMTESNQIQVNKPIAQTQEYLPFIEKYRPTEISQIISQDIIIETIQELIKKNSLTHLLFFGTAGTGKTTCAKAIANQLYGKEVKYMTLELNASDDRGIDVIRERIKDFCSSITNFTAFLNPTNNNKRHKLVILDEADMMTNDAQGALRRIIEKYSANVRFIFICNQVNKIIPALQSRCMKFRFKPISEVNCLNRIKEICHLEKIDYGSEQTLKEIIKIGERDMRKIMNLLESSFMASANNSINSDLVYATAGLPSLSVFKTIIAKIGDKKNELRKIILDLNSLRLSQGYAIEDFIVMLSDYIYENNLSLGGNEQLCECCKRIKEIDDVIRKGGDEELCLMNFVGIIREFNIK